MELLRERVLLIANPGSRRGDRLRERAARAFAREGVECETVVTQAAGHGGDVAAREGRRFRAVFALGGDGTAIEVIAALAGSGVPVGVLPGGTGNLVARSLGIPLRIDDAVPALLGGDDAYIDLGLLGGTQRFAFTLGVGVDARMVEATPAPLKRRYGILAYAIAASREVLGRRTFRARITADDEVIEVEAASVMVANFGVVLGNLFHLGPNIVADDGLLDLCVFSPASNVQALALMWRLLRKDVRPHPALLYRAGRSFRVECDPPQAVQTDGELRCSTPIDVLVEPHAARLLRPKRARRDAEREASATHASSV